MNGSDARTGQHGVDRLGDHGHIDGNAVAFAYAVVAEHVGQATDLALQFAVSDLDALAGRVRLPDQRDLVAAVCHVPVDAIVASIEAAVEEPGHLAVFEVTVAGLAERMEPRQVFLGALSPEGVGIGQALRVQLAIALERRDVRVPADMGGRRIQLRDDVGPRRCRGHGHPFAIGDRLDVTRQDIVSPGVRSLILSRRRGARLVPRAPARQG